MAQGRVSLSLSESASLLFCSEVADYIPKNKLIFLASHPPNMFVHFQVTPLDEPSVFHTRFLCHHARLNSLASRHRKRRLVGVIIVKNVI